MTSVVPATAEHFARLKGVEPPVSCRAYTVLRGGEVLGIGGVYRDGVSAVCFSELTDELRADKRSLVKLVRAVIPMLKPRTLSYADPAIRGSEVLLEHMGFQPYEGRMYQWLG